jgi:protein-L-isoaspartate(D-aspartate) O-methyltransferase
MCAEIHSERFAVERQNMVDSQLRARGIRDPRVLDAMARVPRHQFVAGPYLDQAYEDHPLPIGAGQTVSQPYIVALMLEILSLEPSWNVLEIGTGSGYQTAVLAELAAHVYSVERHPQLAHEAEATLARLGYHNVTIVVGDGSEGLHAQAPFDAIVVSAAAPQIPASLFEQLREGGRMIIPVGAADAQELQLVRKTQGRPLIDRLEGCRFVPLIRGPGSSSHSDQNSDN